MSKTIYDLDKEQRHADWTINATAKTGNSSTGGDYLTDYHIKVTLPKGLTYTDGSSTVGGEYKDTDSGQTQGVVTGGTPSRRPPPRTRTEQPHWSTGSTE